MIIHSELDLALVNRIATAITNKFSKCAYRENKPYIKIEGVFKDYINEQMIKNIEVQSETYGSIFQKTKAKKK